MDGFRQSTVVFQLNQNHGLQDMRASLPTEPASCENSEAENSLEGVRVFFVEDEVLVAMLMEDFLEELGCVVAASAHRVGVALQKIDQVEFDVAVLDINVGGETVTPVAEELERRSIPFIFASGYSGNALDDRFAGRPLLIKPFGQADLAAALLKALAKPAE